jgi:hypothetical protein
MSLPDQDPTPQDLLAVRRGLVACLTALNSPLGLGDLMRIEAGERLPADLPRFVDLVACYFRLDVAQHQALLRQTEYDIIRHSLGAEIARRVFEW